jgi:hypothetical protein
LTTKDEDWLMKLIYKVNRGKGPDDFEIEELLPILE